MTLDSIFAILAMFHVKSVEQKVPVKEFLSTVECPLKAQLHKMAVMELRQVALDNPPITSQSFFFLMHTV